MIRQTEPDLVLSGVVGAAGLKPALAAIDCGATLAIANKETLVMAGALVMPAARAAGITVLPVDSEHSAIFQCLQSGRRNEVRRVVLSASGGALRDWNDAAVANATVDQALNHPNWSMGRKVTIDSATMMNKVLEVIEAHWLFDLAPDQIDVVLHTESILHSAVEFCDGAMITQLSEPDMTTPIAYALSYPHRPVRPTPPLDLGELGQLTFAPISGRFEQAIELAYEVIRLGGSAGAILNGANEAAVDAFLADRIRFGQIVPLVERALTAAEIHHDTTLDALVDADAWARHYVTEHL
jgi:1-deoxy-D-xylulose-5-phosphate reductoisomerase